MTAIAIGGSTLVVEGQSADSKTAAAPKAAAGKAGLPEHVVLTSEQDRKRMMDMLKKLKTPIVASSGDDGETALKHYGFKPWGSLYRYDP